MNTFRYWFIVFPFAALMHGQHPVLLRPIDAVRLAETSNLFESHYARGGCPRAEAGVGPGNEIRLRVEDGCLGGISTWAGDYIVNRKTGEVRVANENTQIAIQRTDPAVSSLWKDIESRLLTEQEAACLVGQTSEYRAWRALGIRVERRFIPEDGSFLARVAPADNNSDVQDRVLVFTIDRSEYRLYRGRFQEGDIGEDVLRLRRIMSVAKRPPELTKLDVIEGTQDLAEVKAWLQVDRCRGIRLDEDQEGVTYYAVDLFRWCDGQDRAESFASFTVDKRSGKIRGPQGITITTERLPNAGARLKALAEEKAEAEKRLSLACPGAGK